jgi:predicted anti-sigma-YlaC factor YlaD
MFDCETCQVVLEKMHADAATPDETQAAREHLASCEDCRDYQAFIAKSTRSVVAVSPEQDLNQLKKRLRRRVRLSVIGPILWAGLLLAALVMTFWNAITTTWIWWVPAGLFAILLANQVRDILEHRRAAERFVEADDFLKRCMDERHLSIGLNALMVIFNFVLALTWTVVVFFLLQPENPWVIALIFWVPLGVNLFRVFVWPNVWNGPNLTVSEPVDES